MIYYLNRGLILEQIIVKSIQEYLNTIGVSTFYKKHTINVTNKHPFARLLLNTLSGIKPDMSVFPAIVVATDDDGKPDSFDDLIEAESFCLDIDDVDILEKRYLMMTKERVEAIRSAVNEKGGVYGVSNLIRRKDRITIEIWSENAQLKNELYELLRLYICGFMKESLSRQYEEYALTIFDKTVRGQRSNNFNVDFGIDLTGAIILFDADYLIEQSVIDTEVSNHENIVMEVINHAKGYEGTTGSVIFSDTADVE